MAIMKHAYKPDANPTRVTFVADKVRKVTASKRLCDGTYDMVT